MTLALSRRACCNRGDRADAGAAGRDRRDDPGATRGGGRGLRSCEAGREAGPTRVDACRDGPCLELYGRRDTVIFNRQYKTLGVDKGDEREVARVDYDPNTVWLRDGNGDLMDWRPYLSAGAKGGVEVYRSEEMELRQEDRVRWTRNDPGSGLANGETAVVESVGKDGVRFRLEDGTLARLAEGNSQLRHLDRAWASTVHAFLGRTVDGIIAAVPTGNPDLTNQRAFYVAISRARDHAEPVTAMPGSSWINWRERRASGLRRSMGRRYRPHTRRCSASNPTATGRCSGMTAQIAASNMSTLPIRSTGVSLVRASKRTSNPTVQAGRNTIPYRKRFSNQSRSPSISIARCRKLASFRPIPRPSLPTIPSSRAELRRAPCRHLTGPWHFGRPLPLPASRPSGYRSRAQPVVRVSRVTRFGGSGSPSCTGSFAPYCRA